MLRFWRNTCIHESPDNRTDAFDGVYLSNDDRVVDFIADSVTGELRLVRVEPYFGFDPSRPCPTSLFGPRRGTHGMSKWRNSRHPPISSRPTRWTDPSCSLPSSRKMTWTGPPPMTARPQQRPRRSRRTRRHIWRRAGRQIRERRIQAHLRRWNPTQAPVASLSCFENSFIFIFFSGRFLFVSL